MPQILSALILMLASFYPGSVMGSTPVKEIKLPSGLSSPGSLAVGPSGKVWFAEKVGKHLAAYDPDMEKFELHVLPSSWGNIGPGKIAMGPDGDVWFTVHRWAEGLEKTDIIGRFSPSAETFQKYKIPNATPEELKIDPGGTVWVLDADKLFKFDPNTSELNSYTIPTPNSHPRGLVMDQVGMLWFVEANANKVAGFSPDKNIFGEVGIPTQFFSPSGTAIDDDGNVWFTGLNANMLAVYYPEKRIFNQINVPTPRGLPNNIVHDGQGGVWFLEYRGNKIGYFDPNSAIIREYEIPTYNSLPIGLAIDTKRGVLWFSQTSTESRRLGKVSIKEAKAASVALEAGQAPDKTENSAAIFIAAALFAISAVGAYLFFKRENKVQGAH